MGFPVFIARGTWEDGFTPAIVAKDIGAASKSLPGCGDSRGGRLVMTKRMMQQSRKLLAVWLLPLPSPTHLSLSSCSTHLEHQKWNSSCPNMPSYYQMTKYCGQNLKSHSWMLKSGGQNLQSHSRMLKSRGQNLQSHSRMLKSRGRNLASHSRTPKSWDPPCVRTYVGARKATLPEGIVRAPDGDLGCCVRSNSRS